MLVFKSRIDRDAIEVDRARVTIVDAGERSIIFEPVIELRSAERLVLSVPFADGQRAVFVLVASPSEVDTRIDVVRREQTVEACQAELAETQARCSKLSPVRFAGAGWLTRQGVIARTIRKCNGEHPTADGLVCTSGTAYRAEKWALVDVLISNASNAYAWVPSEVTIKGTKSGVSVKGTVEMDAAQIAPGEERHVFVEVDPSSDRELLTLELRDSAGRAVPIPVVDLSTPESKQ